MKKLIVSCYLAAALPLFAQAPSGSELLDKVITQPGSYSQVCDVMTAPTDIPYRAYQITDFFGASFSKSNTALIKANRPALTEAIRARLAKIDLTQKPVQPKEDPKPEENFDGDPYGCDPASLNPLILNLIVDIEAIETLPELLVLEDKLVADIAKAKDSATAPVPFVDGWGVAEEGSFERKESEEKRERNSRLFNARVAQRDLVMVMQLLMRQKNYGPALSTKLETAYIKGLKAEAAKEGWDLYKPGDELPKEIKYVEVERDPVSKVVRSVYSHVAVPYTRESRDEVRAAAQQWIKEHP